jgi:hypothetical protein
MLQYSVTNSIHTIKIFEISPEASTDVSVSPQQNSAYQNHSSGAIYSKYPFFSSWIYHTVRSVHNVAIFWKIQICLGYLYVVRASSTKMFCICQMSPWPITAVRHISHTVRFLLMFHWHYMKVTSWIHNTGGYTFSFHNSTNHTTAAMFHLHVRIYR